MYDVRVMCAYIVHHTSSDIKISSFLTCADIMHDGGCGTKASIFHLPPIYMDRLECNGL